MIGDWIVKLREKLRDTVPKLDELSQRHAIEEAVLAYSTDFPTTKIQTITGDGVAYIFALATDFDTAYSVVTSVEHPVGNQSPTYVDPADYAVLQQPDDTSKLQFRTLVIENGDDAYVKYTAGHTVSDTVDTVPRRARDAVINYACSICCLELAAYYAQTSDPTMGADAVSYAQKSAQYIELAKMYRSRYDEFFGVSGEDGVIGASGVKDLDVEFQNMIGDRFFHSNKWR